MPSGTYRRDGPWAPAPDPSNPRGVRLVPSSAVITVEHGGRVVLVDMRAGRRVTLDDFGRQVWALVAARPTLPALVERLRGDDAGTARLARDVARLLDSWLAEGMVAWR